MQHINIIGPRQLGWLQSSSPRRICRDLHLAKSSKDKWGVVGNKSCCLPLPSALASFICRQQFVRFYASCGNLLGILVGLVVVWHLLPCFGVVHWARFVFVAHSSGDAKQQIFSECVKDQFCAKYGYERLLMTKSRRLSKHFPAFICVFPSVYVCVCVYARYCCDFL